MACKLIPCLSLHISISGTAGRVVHSAGTAKHWRYATNCSAFIASLGCIVLALSACAVAPAAPGAGLPVEIARAAKDACTVARDCAAIGIGARACGGPADYLVYSHLASDVPVLMHAVTEYNAAQKERVRRSGRLSTCDVLPAPTVTCNAGRCVADPRANGPAPLLAPQ